MNIYSLLAAIEVTTPLLLTIGAIIVALVLIGFLPRLLGVVYIPHIMIGVIEKIWSRRGSLKERQIIARQGEAGFQTRLLRGGLHFGLYPWQYKVHKTPLVVIGEGKMVTSMRAMASRWSQIKHSAATSRATTSRMPKAFYSKADNAVASVDFCVKVSTR